MSAPPVHPPGPPPDSPAPRITGTGPDRSKAETKRVLTARILRAMRRAGLAPQGWQVRSLLATLVANREEPTDEELLQSVMRAPWYPKPRKRRYQVGETGWRTST